MSADAEESGERLRGYARHGETDGVRRLLAEVGDASALLAAQDAQSGNTALHFCCANGHAEIATALIDAGAPVNAVNKSGSSALHYASLTGQMGVVRCLVRAGATLMLRNNFGNDAHDEAVQCGHKEVAAFLMAENEKRAAEAQADK